MVNEQVTFIGFRGRPYSLGTKVRVYRNLNNGKFSVQAVAGEFKGKVICHLDSLELTDVVFKISLASRQRVIAQKTKNVHAFAIGSLSKIAVKDCDKQTEISYCPYSQPHFFDVRQPDIPVTKLNRLNLLDAKAFC